jgi:hypothetical protein
MDCGGVFFFFFLPVGFPSLFSHPSHPRTVIIFLSFFTLAGM